MTHHPPTHPPTCSVHEALDRINADVTVPCAHVAGGEERVQLAVALTHKLRRTGYDVMEEAEGFARALHNECACSTQMNGCRRLRSVHRLAGWLADHRPQSNPSAKTTTGGVGSAACQAGALLFLSRVDRAMYISRGRGLEELLTDHRIDQVGWFGDGLGRCRRVAVVCGTAAAGDCSCPCLFSFSSPPP